jgi:hypothetical protein
MVFQPTLELVPDAVAAVQVSLRMVCWRGKASFATPVIYVEYTGKVKGQLSYSVNT